MSRFCGEKKVELILEAAARWRDGALLTESSVFTTKHLWTLANIEALEHHFVRNLDEGEGSFMDKLEHQLSDADAGAKQLAAEMMWVMYLCPSSLTPRHKRDIVQTMWSWSGEGLPEDQPMFAEPILTGAGSAGPGFNQYLWKELVFFINTMLAFRRLPSAETQRLVNDGWAFAEWIQGVPDSGNRQFRHMLLFLLFPDDFERIFGQRDRRAVIAKFSGLESRAINKLTAVEFDRALRDIRKKLEARHETTQLDFYVPPLKGTWRAEEFSEVTNSITARHVEQAIADIDRDGVPPSAQSVFYDLVHKARRYPAKLVLSLAAKHANGEELDRNMFSGGEASPAFKLLRKLGFVIEPKDSIPALLSKFLTQAKSAKELSVQGYLDRYRNLEVKVSFGKGNIARIPWIAFLSPGQVVSKGIYPVLLLFREEQVLLMCYGISEENKPERAWSDVGSAQTVQAWFKERFGRSPDRYGASFVRAAYELGKPLPVQELVSTLDQVINEYENLLGLEQTTNPPPEDPETPLQPEILAVKEDLREAASAFSEALHGSFISFGADHDGLVMSLIASVATKPFVILTGQSGSGKSQIAIRLGEWLGEERLLVAAVRPDWTGAEALFGYEDGLKPAIDGHAAWTVPMPLAFMLRAAGDPQHPYLLLLDEMNLAHVERYFADVLSGMESGQACLPNLVLGNDGVWRQKAGGKSHISFPRNLWIIGTVNVDETTYMFSPKVLDRANTFEFRVEGSALQPSVRKPVRCEPAEQALVRGLLAIARNDSWQDESPSTFRDELAEKLRQLHDTLGRHGMEFGHRVFYESLRFAALAEMSGMESMELVLDRIVLQKILPRLHGSRRRLELPLLALAHFARDLPEAIASDEKLSTMELEEVVDGIAKLPGSHHKVLRMLRSLRANQFASFTE